MPVPSKTFTYELDGLSYTVTVYEEAGSYYADITVDEGAMDVNAIYFGDDYFSGDSESLNGPLNMNGARLEGEDVQWDDAVTLSSPGLGREGTDKETYLAEGDTLTVELDIESLDDIDVLGIRATSTTTPEGSIKAVSDDPEEPVDEDEPVFEKIGFGYEIGETGLLEDGIYVGADELPEGQEGTFENFVDAFEVNPYGDVTQLQTVIFYEINDEGELNEAHRIEAPDEGFADTDELLAAYDEAVEDGVFDDAGTLIAALGMDESEDDDGEASVDEDIDDELMV
ncbi:hypothetical protein N6L24_10925 [Cognatishimia sp. SS12]|uniref:hypothetical protein n=1 Tax=Cognatishimia sp. SS12 TaxID=2979465 RepID=UPI00232B5FF9|nr:hypothetical protein [Cognatishimia sp. SS12]MDC0738795.1 hypothetical protein [Cognatishimia sp. SS12]